MSVQPNPIQIQAGGQSTSPQSSNEARLRNFHTSFLKFCSMSMTKDTCHEKSDSPPRTTHGNRNGDSDQGLLKRFQNYWTRLRQIQGRRANTGKQSRTGTIDSDQVERRETVKQLCITYMSSFPGLDNASPNTSPHGMANRIIKNINAEPDENIARIQPILHYRMNSMQLATKYKTILHLPFTDCENFCVEEWQEDLAREELAKGNKHPDRSTKYRLFEEMEDRIFKAGIFPEPMGDNLGYYKPHRYLAIALIETKKDKGEIEEAIASLVRGK